MNSTSKKHMRALMGLQLTLLLALALAQPAAAQEHALGGKVSSQREGAMEGVLVSASKEGSTITVTVASDAKGEYRFPASRLAPGRYALSIRAAGYALERAPSIEITPGKAAVADLALVPAEPRPEQITNAEWLASAPGPDEMKRLMLNCTDCHGLQRILQSRHTAADFLKVFDRMAGYYPGASDHQPQRLVGEHRRPAVPAAMREKFAEYLAGINQNGRAAPPFAIQQMERPKGRATRVIVTEYDLPRREIQPHDVIVDPDGMVWFSHFGEQLLSKLDPRTGRTTDYPIPVQKPDHPKGTLDLEIDQDGNIWVALMYQSGMARFDRKTETLRLYPIPQEWQRDATQQSHFSVAASKVDGKAWVKNTDGAQVMRLDIASGQYENLGSFRNPRNDRPIGFYGIYADQQNNAYILEFGAGGIGKIDAQTGKIAFFPTPTLGARARRGRVDAQNRLWFAEFGGNAIGLFDPKTETITEYRKPLGWEAPYDVVADRNGDVWEVNETSDRVGRLDPRSAEFTNYLMPRSSNFRRVFADDRAREVAVWIGNNLGASIVKIEPLE
jgi:virginiamycin B lyase